MRKLTFNLRQKKIELLCEECGKAYKTEAGLAKHVGSHKSE